MGSIADLIRYRTEHEQSVEKSANSLSTTEFGEFDLVCFEDHVSRNVHFALVKGDLSTARRRRLCAYICKTRWVTWSVFRIRGSAGRCDP